MRLARSPAVLSRRYTAAGGGITDPDDIAGLVCWFDASNTGSLTYNGTQYTRWDDLKSGYDIGMTNTSLAPVQGGTLNGVTVIQHVTDDFLTQDSSHGAGYMPAYTGSTLTWFGVIRKDSNSESYGRVVKFTDDIFSNEFSSDSWWCVIRDGSSGNWPCVARNGFLLDPGSDLGASAVWVRVIVRFTGSTAELYVNGSLVDSASDSRAFSFEDYETCGLVEGGDISFAEHGFYTASLTTGQIADLDAYLETHWGL